MFSIKCTSCSLLLGESETAVENIVCVFCIDERNYFRGIFSSNTDHKLGEEYETYWAKYERFETYREMPHFYMPERQREHQEIKTFMAMLKYKCDKEENNE